MTTDKIRWKNPGPVKRVGGGVPGLWVLRLSPVMERPGRWALVSTHASESAAASCAANLRTRRIKRPEGDWEFTSRGADVYARYNGAE